MDPDGPAGHRRGGGRGLGSLIAENLIHTGFRDLCLIDPDRVAAEEHAGRHLGGELVQRGYVRGREVKEPAVKTLNAVVAGMAVDALVNQYTERQPHAPVR